MASACGLKFDVQITGDCSNSGSGGFSINIYGNAPDYVIQFISPTTDVYYLTGGATAYTFNSLSQGTYVFEVIDSCVSGGTPTVGSVYISSGTSVTCTGIQNTSNSLTNGAITAQTSNLYGQSYFYLYDFTTGYIKSGSSFTTAFTFNNLSASTYYVVADNGGGCTGQSETVIIKSSTTFDFGFYIVDDSGCDRYSGKVFVTGQTGVGPYSYLWTNGETTSSISGLSAGNYGVVVTDKDGATNRKNATVGTTKKLKVVNSIITPPSCYSDDGIAEIIIEGGTPPFTYQLSNGFTNVSFLRNIIINNLPANKYTITVTDAGLCNVKYLFSVTSEEGLTVTSVDVVNATCGSDNGEISVQIIGGTPAYNYVLIDSGGNRRTFSTIRTSHIFSNLFAGDYTLLVNDLGPCTYSGSVSVLSTNSFDFSVSTTDIIANSEYGEATIELTSGGVAPYVYNLSSKPQVKTTQSSFTFKNLEEGYYSISVTDSNNCTMYKNFSINYGIRVKFSLSAQKTQKGNDGKIEVYITEGKPPYQIEWSSNVNGQTGTSISNLSAGTYTVKITDSEGSVQTRSVDIQGTSLVSSYQTYNICDSNITNSGNVIKKGLQQMLKEGFYDLTVGDNNCVLNQGIFSAIVYLSGITTSSIFYTTESLNDFPSDNTFYDVVEQLLLSYDGVDSVIFKSNTNQILINTGCDNQTVSLIDSPVQVSVKIDYDITCQSCGGDSIPASYPLVVTDNSIYGFDPENRTFVPLPQSDEYTNALGIAINTSETKLWVLNIDGQTIFEYDVNSLVPYNIEYNRSITLSSTVSRDLISVDSSTLYSANDNSPYLSSIDLTNGNITNGIFLSVIPFTVVNYSMLINSLNNIIVITNDIDGFLYLRQYDKAGPLLVEVSLPATVGYTMYEHNSVFYLVDLGNYQVYSILTSSPYTLTPEFTIDPPVTTSIFIMSQINTYVTTNFT